MNRFHMASNRPSGNELERVIEPLASYICAADHPKSALMSALAVLIREVKATNGVAKLHFQNFTQN